VNELRERTVEVWAELQLNVIDDAIDQWRRRLHAWLRAIEEDTLSICCECILATYRIWVVKFVENLLIYR